MVFLAGVLVTAVTLGSGPAYFAAALAFLVYNIYLVEPRFSFQLVSPEDILLLIVFAAVAILTGRLAGRVRDEMRRAESRARTAATLFEASQDVSALDTEAAIRDRLAGHIARAATGAALVWDQTGSAFSTSDAPPPDDLRALARSWPSLEPSRRALEFGDWRVRPLRANGEDLGAAAWRITERTGSEVEEQLIAVLVELGAAAIARARLSGVRAEVQAAARTEQLRNALLSSISHDLRTPLAAILASASSLREFGDRFSPAVQSDLVQTIEEEADRLNRYVANLLNMTKLESGALTLDLGPCRSRRGRRKGAAAGRPQDGRPSGRASSCPGAFGYRRAPTSRAGPQQCDGERCAFQSRWQRDHSLDVPPRSWRTHRDIG